MMNKDARIYVAGHRGMVGSAIVRSLTHQGYTHLLLKTREEMDLFDRATVQAFFVQEKPQYVIVAAARVGGIQANMMHPAEFLHENLLIQDNIIWSAHESGVEKLLFLGSSCIYPRECPQPMKEEYFLTGTLEPTNEGYAIAKIAGIKLCEYIFQEFHQHFISNMPTNIYGESDNFDPVSSHVIPAMIRRFHEAKVQRLPEVVIWGSGNSRREFLYVDDLADATVWMMNHYDEKQFLNIGTGEDVSIAQLAQSIQSIVGYDGKVRFDVTKPDGMPRKLLDVRRVHALGWTHAIGLEQGLRKTYDWYCAHSR